MACTVDGAFVLATQTTSVRIALVFIFHQTQSINILNQDAVVADAKPVHTTGKRKEKDWLCKEREKCSMCYVNEKNRGKKLERKKGEP